MDRSLKRKALYELLWLISLIALSAMAEYIIIVTFDLHPVLSVKIQGIIGLLIFGYGIRMVARLLSSFKVDDGNPGYENQDGIEVESDNN